MEGHNIEYIWRACRQNARDIDYSDYVDFTQYLDRPVVIPNQSFFTRKYSFNTSVFWKIQSDEMLLCWI